MEAPTTAPESVSLGLGLTNQCNLACAHCYRDAANVTELSLEQVRASCESMPIRSVNLGTGENSLHPRFLEILEYLVTLDSKLTITSNGRSTKLLTDDQLRGFHSIEFSLDFATEEEHDAFREPGNWRLVMEQIERCQRLEIPVTITCVMMSLNYDQIDGLARVASEVGATLRVNVYQAVQTDEFSLSYEQFWAGYKKLFAETALVTCNEPIVRAVLGMKEARAGGCGRTTVRVTPKVEVLPCVYWPADSVSLQVEDLVERGLGVLESDQFTQLSTVPEFCKSCEFVETCGGGCAGRRRLRGKLDEPDEFCPFYRGETIDLECAEIRGRDLPKAASACTVIVEGRTQA